MRHTGLTFRSLRGSCLRCEISQKLGPCTAAFSAGNCSWGFSSELWMGFTVGPERRVQSKVPQGLTAAGSPGFFSSLFTGTHWHCLCLSGASDFLFQDPSEINVVIPFLTQKWKLQHQWFQLQGKHPVL